MAFFKKQSNEDPQTSTYTAPAEYPAADLTNEFEALLSMHQTEVEEHHEVVKARRSVVNDRLQALEAEHASLGELDSRIAKHREVL